MSAPGRLDPVSPADPSAIAAARDLMLAGELLRETIGWADRRVAELEARWAANRAARARADEDRAG